MPTFKHWQKNVTASKDSEDKFPKYCVEECKSNCTNDGQHKCFGKVLQGKETLRLIST